MFKINEIKELIRTLDKSTVTELTIKGENKAQITIKKGGYVVPSVEQVAEVTPAVQVQQTPAESQVKETPVVKEEPKASAPAQETKVSDDANLHKIVSPMVGTFYAAPAPDAEPYVKVGDRVKEDTVVCIVEAMKLMNELEAEVSGEIVEILVENAQLVEYGQPLFLVKKD